MAQIDVYDKNKEYLEEIAPIIKELKIACNLLKLPLFLTVAVANNEEGTEYKNDAIHASADVCLKEDRIADIILLLNGFQPDLPDYIKRDLQELQDYAAKRSQIQKSEDLSIQLKEDKTHMFHQITECGDAVKPPMGMIDHSVTDEFFDE